MQQQCAHFVCSYVLDRAIHSLFSLSLSLFFSVSFVRSLDSSPTCLLASLATACLLACSLIRSFLTFVCFNYNISNATIMHLLKLTSSTTATATPTVTVTVTGQLR